MKLRLNSDDEQNFNDGSEPKMCEHRYVDTKTH